VITLYKIRVCHILIIVTIIIAVKRQDDPLKLHREKGSNDTCKRKRA
jgi:hypothetical protein